MSKQFTTDTIAKHAEMLANRVRKNLKRLKPAFDRKNIGAFRLYDKDIPEVRAVVDWYEGEIVLAEYVREQTEDLPYLETLQSVLANRMDIPPEKIHLRKRTTRPKDRMSEVPNPTWMSGIRPKAGQRYTRLAKTGIQISVREGDLKFLVNLDDYLDTGLFTDHRITRSLIRSLSPGKTFLNLYGYTGSFTVYAAAGGAISSETVDASGIYLKWAEENMILNGLSNPDKHRMIPATAEEFFERAEYNKMKWDLIFLDPPSFSSGENKEEFDIQFDHRGLVERTLGLLLPGGTIIFSTNHQRFEPLLDGLGAKNCIEITKETTPIDYAGRTPHRCFKLGI